MMCGYVRLLVVRSFGVGRSARGESTAQVLLLRSEGQVVYADATMLQVSAVVPPRCDVIANVLSSLIFHNANYLPILSYQNVFEAWKIRSCTATDSMPSSAQSATKVIGFDKNA